MEELNRVVAYSLEFYFKKIALLALFSIPFFAASLVPVLVPLPTYLAAGALFARTGSLPDFSILDISIIVIAYLIAMFIIADTIVNINIIVRSKRTLTETTQEMISAVPKHATRIFCVLTIVFILHLIAQLLLHDIYGQTVIYPLFSFVLSYLLLFVPPAIVIDDSDVGTAIIRSGDLALRKPLLCISWLAIGALTLVLSKISGDFLFSGVFSQYFALLVNSIVLLPFLIILQTQMYMEKYPLAR